MHTPKFNLPLRMNVKEVATALSASEASIWRWAGDTIPAPVERRNRHVRWSGIEIEQYLKKEALRDAA